VIWYLTISRCAEILKESRLCASQPKWCPAGLTKSQKRRVQRLCQSEILEEEQKQDLNKRGVRSQVWRVKPRSDDKKDPGSSAAPVNMVFIMPREFMAPIDSDEGPELEEAMAQLALELVLAMFEKPEDDKRQHLKALFLKGFVDGKPITKMLVDGGAAVNIMPYVMLRKLGKSSEDLTKTDMMLKDFEGVVSPALGALCIDLTIGCKTLSTTFFIINGKGSYNLLLGQDWIHANCCIPSTMHQCLIQWIDDTVEVVYVDLSFSIASVEAHTWSYEKVSYFSGQA